MAYPGNIDQQVNQVANANRGNPGALQQKYQLDQSLISLLALQKLTADKKAAEKEIVLSQQNNPATIKEQLEQDATNRTVKEVTEGVGGVLANRNRMQQNNLQRMARGRPGGIANQPTPNIARMAGGGIVSFANGGGVSDEQLELLKVSREVFEGFTDRGKRILLDTLNPTSKFKADIAPQVRKNTLIREANRARREGGTNPFSQLYNYFAGSPEDMNKISAKADAGIERSNLIRSLASPQGAVPFSSPKQNAGILAEQKRMQQGQLGLPAETPPPPVGGGVVPMSNQIGVMQPGDTSFKDAYKQGIAQAETTLGRDRQAGVYKELLDSRRALNERLAADQPGFFDRFAGAQSLTGAAVNKENMRRQRIKEATAREGALFDTAEKGLAADRDLGKSTLTAAGVYGRGQAKEVSDRLTREISREANRLRAKLTSATTDATRSRDLSTAIHYITQARLKASAQSAKILEGSLPDQTEKDPKRKAAMKEALLKAHNDATKKALSPLIKHISSMLKNRLGGGNSARVLGQKTRTS